MNERPVVALLAGVVLSLAGCSGVTNPSATPPTQLVLMTHDSFAVSDGIIERFKTEHHVDVQVLKSGDAGEMVNKAILTKDAPLADVLYGVDNSFLSRALDAGIFDPYASPGVSQVPTALQEGTRSTVTPIDYGDVCLNYDKEAFTASLPAPTVLSDLLDPRYKDMLVVENPATSSPGLAFLLATIGSLGADNNQWQDYWRGLRQNGVSVVNDWNTAYYSSFSGGAGTGDRPIVVSYATSPVAEVYYADPPVDESPIGTVTDGCFRQVEYAGVLKGAKAPELARQFVDYMLTADFQADIPLNMFVFPANSQATVPQVFLDNAANVPAPISLSVEDIAANRDRWVQEWTDVVLH